MRWGWKLCYIRQRHAVCHNTFFLLIQPEFRIKWIQWALQREKSLPPSSSASFDHFSYGKDSSRYRSTGHMAFASHALQLYLWTVASVSRCLRAMHSQLDSDSQGFQICFGQKVKNHVTLDLKCQNYARTFEYRHTMNADLDGHTSRESASSLLGLPISLS